MADEPELKTKLTVDTQNLIDGMKNANEHMENAVSGMKGNLGSLSAAFAELGPAVLVIAAIGLALEGLKESVAFAAESFHKFIEAAETMHTLREKTGESYDALAGYNATMKMTGGNVEQLGTWMKAATRAMKQNEDQIQANGIATRKANGDFVSFGDYIVSVGEKLKETRGGFDKTSLAMLTMSKAGSENIPQLQRFAEVLKEGQEVAKEFGMTIGAEDVEAMEALQKEQGKLSYAFDLMKVAIGRELMPVVKEFVGFLASNLPEALAIFKYTLEAVIEGCIILSLGIKEMIIAGETGFEVLSLAATAFLNVLENPTHAIEIQKQFAKDVADAWMVSMAVAKGFALEAQLSIANIGKPQKAAEGGDKKFVPKKEQDKEVEALKAAFEEYKKEKIRENEWSLEAEAKFWEKRVGIYDKGSKANTMVESEAQKIKLQLQAKAYEAEKTTLEHELKDEATTSARRLEIAKQLSELSTKFYNVAHKDQQKLALERVDIERKVADQILKIREMGEEKAIQHSRGILALEEAQLRHREAMGEITLDELYRGEEAFAQKKAALDEEEARRRAALMKDRELAAATLAKDLEKIHGELALQVQSIEDKRAEGMREKWLELGNSIKGTFSTVIQGLLNGTMTWANAFKSILSGVSQAFVKMGADMLMDYIVRLGKMLLRKYGFIAAETAADSAARATESTSGVVADKILALSAAGLAAVNAMASVAAIPFYGWAMAPGVGAETFAIASGFASASGGWDEVDRDQFARVHKSEMVMSAPLAEGLRNLISSGGGKSGDSGNDYQINISAIDGPSVKQFMKTHGHLLFDAVKAQAKNHRGN